MSIDTRDERLERRIADLNASDPQFAAAAPDDADLRRDRAARAPARELVATVFDGYADRPALGRPRRRVHHRSPAPAAPRQNCSPASRPSPTASFPTACSAITNALADDPVRPGDRVALLGFTSVDYTSVDMALIGLGAVSVPLQTSAPVAQLRPIVAETEPTAIAASVDYLGDAVELVLAGPRRPG